AALPLKVIAQINDFWAPYDSLRSDYRIDGDMFELEQSSQFFDVSFMIPGQSSPFLSTAVFGTYGSKIHQFRKKDISHIVSPLAHIGFSYTFGMQGAQRLGFEYQQVYKGGSVLNARISNVKSIGYFRNMELGKTDFETSVSKRSDRYGFSFTGRTSKLSRSWSGGVIDASLLEVFAPLTVPVYKSSCNSELKYFDIEALGYLTLVDNGKYNIGISHKISVNGENRVFNERDTLAGLYPSIYFDSVSTNDQYQIGRLDNHSAIYFYNDHLAYSIGLSSTYWNYRNMNLYRDTIELNAFHDFKFQRNKLSFLHEASLNTVGAAQTWSSKNHLYYQHENWSFSLKSFMGQKLPAIFQRFYSANNTNYSNSNLSLQGYTSSSAEVNYTTQTYDLSACYRLESNSGIYFYDKSISNWSNQTALSSSIIQQLYLNSNFKFQKLKWQQKYVMTLSNLKKNIVPVHQLQGSIMTSLGLFKAKKLKVTFGLSYRLNSKTNVIPIIENIGVYDLLNVSDEIVKNPLFTMGAMLGMEIETFRFYIKFSNMGYFWNSPTWQYIEGIYLPESSLRVGLTWDFWN
ncbi:MAG: putative porin, partial [Crocinitomicaceae bacterium]|nr:putative porin [Crocinitomicaceae bacterium]